MTILIIEIITIVITMLSFMVVLINQNKKSKNELIERVQRDTIISTKLDMVINGNNELKQEVDRLNHKTTELLERIVLVEASSNSAHKRIDELVRK